MSIENEVTDISNEDVRELVAEAVTAKMVYWDAMRAIEQALTTDPSGDVSDQAASKLVEFVDILASGLDVPLDVLSKIEPEHAARVVKIFEGHPL